MIENSDKQTAFLRNLISHADTSEAHELIDRLRQVQNHVRCCRRAIFLVSVMAGLAFCGLAYGAVLLPEFFQQYTAVVQGFTVLLLASVISAVIFFGTLLWYRSQRATAHDECRKLLMHTFDRRLS